MSTVITIACQWKNFDSESLLFQEDLFRYTTRKNQERKEVMIYRKDGYFNNSPMKFSYMLLFFSFFMFPNEVSPYASSIHFHKISSSQLASFRA